MPLAKLLAVIFLSAAALVAQAQTQVQAQVPAQVRVSEAWARASIPGTASSAAFATLVNRGQTAVTLVSVKVAGVDKAELHSHSHEGGMMRMRRVDSVTIAAGASLALAPGGYHVMLFLLREPLREGAQLAMEFHFSDGSKAEALAEVRR